VYCCGVGGSDYIPAAELRQGAFLSGCDPKEARVEAATATLHAMSDAYKGIAPKSSQACMRPCAPDALPIMGPVPGVAGAFLNYAHNCAFNQPSPDPKRDNGPNLPLRSLCSLAGWGIAWAPATGTAMAELICLGETTFDLSAFNVERFGAPAKRGGRGRKKKGEAVGEQW
jgi:glycine/D-amino acid oxidase-like deaminating enzyme